MSSPKRKRVFKTFLDLYLLSYLCISSFLYDFSCSFTIFIEYVEARVFIIYCSVYVQYNSVRIYNVYLCVNSIQSLSSVFLLPYSFIIPHLLYRNYLSLCVRHSNNKFLSISVFDFLLFFPWVTTSDGCTDLKVPCNHLLFPLTIVNLAAAWALIFHYSILLQLPISTHACFFFFISFASASESLRNNPTPATNCSMLRTPWQLTQVIIPSELCVPWSLGHHQGAINIRPKAPSVVSPPVFRDGVLPSSYQPSLHCPRPYHPAMSSK